MSLLLALTAVAPTPPPVEIPAYSGGWPTKEPRRKRKAEPWQDELKRLFAPPEPAKVAAPVAVVVERAPEAPKLDAASSAYIDGVFAAIVHAKNLQEQARKAKESARAERELIAAQALMAAAVEAERIAQQEMMDFDVAYVAAVLAHM